MTCLIQPPARSGQQVPDNKGFAESVTTQAIGSGGQPPTPGSLLEPRVFRLLQFRGFFPLETPTAPILSFATSFAYVFANPQCRHHCPR